MLKKISKEFVKKSFSDVDTVIRFAKAVEEIGLWKSEKLIFKHFFNREDKILDIGCGVGRTTFGLNNLGYSGIQGIDLSESMIKKAKELACVQKKDISFNIGDATFLQFKNECFDSALFSFNGIMQIPKIENRIKAMAEVNRILKRGGFFIFTTHDREKVKGFEWNEERNKWIRCLQDKRLHEFGDKIINKGQDTFIHYPTRDEVILSIKKAGLTLVEKVSRSELCKEDDKVSKWSSDCIFWITQKS